MAVLFLLAQSIQFDAESGVLTLKGGAQRDGSSIHFYQDQLYASLISKTPAGEKVFEDFRTYKLADVKEIVFYGYGENDTFGNYTSIPSRAYGGSGNDWLVGGKAGDQLYGGDGIDRLEGWGGDDYIHGGAGMDFIYGGDGDDDLHGGSGNDYLYGQNGNDTIYGNDGDDELIGGPGVDELFGGPGTDTKKQD
jgi:Ca2+-binding RTX toxin-like protein